MSPPAELHTIVI